MVRLSVVFPTSVGLLFVIFFAFSNVGSAAFVQGSKKACVLLPDGSQECSQIDALSALTGRKKVPCQREDIACWNKSVLKYTNKVRRQNGISPLLTLGPKRQLQNANKYAKILSNRGALSHQNLPAATKEVKCKRWIGGENLAFNYEAGDIAKACVTQWINSPGHFANLIRDWFEEMVTGFHFDKDGRVYCVQTFSLLHPSGTFGSADGKNCEPVA